MYQARIGSCTTQKLSSVSHVSLILCMKIETKKWQFKTWESLTSASLSS
jgi:uncharacterized protein